MDGPRSHSLVSWATRTQQGTAKSTGDAETTAIGEYISTSGESMRTLLEQLYARSVWLIMRSDADVAISAIRKGYSRKLSYLRRTQKISLGFLHDYTHDEYTLLQKVRGDSNDSDVLTKGLDHITHWRHLHALGMRPTQRVPIENLEQGNSKV